MRENPKWTRNPQGDRPALVFPSQYANQEPTVIDQQLGFLNEFQSPIEVSVDQAIKLGLVGQSIARLSMPISDYIELQQKKTPLV